eukprot:SAG11_NODE_2529_length_3251_cov_2.339467_2_plen_84_part_00
MMHDVATYPVASELFRGRRRVCAVCAACGVCRVSRVSRVLCVFHACRVCSSKHLGLSPFLFVVWRIGRPHVLAAHKDEQLRRI